ncbi:hypothetical protein, partial [Vibrio parahaemolyticus]|uniref:hypothetical protein n=1 Tax=Vibrio parahaemolyticus TaxID=670 RepID=UPI0015DE8A40
MKSEKTKAKSQQSSSGKMSPASSVVKTMPLDAFLLDLPGKVKNLSQQGENGQTLVLCLDHKELLAGESSMLNISECP